MTYTGWWWWWWVRVGRGSLFLIFVVVINKLVCTCNKCKKFTRKQSICILHTHTNKVILYIQKECVYNNITHINKKEAAILSSTIRLTMRHIACGAFGWKRIIISSSSMLWLVTLYMDGTPYTTYKIYTYKLYGAYACAWFIDGSRVIFIIFTVVACCCCCCCTATGIFALRLTDDD